MLQKKANFSAFYLILLIFCLPAGWSGSFCLADEQLDKTKYITIDEIQPGMEAYCRTVYKGTKVEKFALEVISVLRNIRPSRKPGSRDAILVKGIDERFIHTGTVHGCSGSPVYINGRMAGALGFGWAWGKDPLYIVTPIEDMLSVGRYKNTLQDKGGPAMAIDFSRPVDFADVMKQVTSPASAKQNFAGNATTLPIVFATSIAPTGEPELLKGALESLGLFPAYAPSAAYGGSDDIEDVPFEPGATLAVPLITGDIRASAIGTVTEVIGDKVYGFGHRFLGYGPVDLPMATGSIHTVVASRFDSWKFGQAGVIKGALRADESAAVVGLIGAKAKMIPLRIKVDRYNDPEERIYNCQLAVNRQYTPLMLAWAINGATILLGDLPPDHSLNYTVTIETEDADSIAFENVSTSLGLQEMLAESVGPVALLMNNPYEKVDIKSINFDVRIVPKNIVSHIWSVDMSSLSVKAGKQVELEVVLESWMAGKQKYHFNLKIPDRLKPGKYNLIICGGYGYRDFLRKAAPYKFVPDNMTTLIEVINNILAIKRDRLYCILVLPPGGVAIEKAELPDLPPTKALILGNTKRTLRTQSYKHWVQSSRQTGTIVVDKKVMHITVER